MRPIAPIASIASTIPITSITMSRLPVAVLTWLERDHGILGLFCVIGGIGTSSQVCSWKGGGGREIDWQRQEQRE